MSERNEFMQSWYSLLGRPHEIFINGVYFTTLPMQDNLIEDYQAYFEQLIEENCWAYYLSSVQVNFSKTGTSFNLITQPRGFYALMSEVEDYEP